MNKKTLNTEKYITLAQAVKLANRVPADQAFVYDQAFVKPMYQQVLPNDTQAAMALKAQAYGKAFDTARKEPLSHAKCWPLRDVTKLTPIQREYLLTKGRMFYAPELKNLESTLLKHGLDVI